jgi:aryl-alcohol dehydrogenase-like predicted oxidoreductase
MEYTKLGDMEVSRVSLGCFAFGGDRVTGSHNGASFAALHAGVWGEQKEEDTFATVKAALDAGINFLDTAEMYGGGYSEEVTGRALRASGYSREKYYVATKVSESNLSAVLVHEHVRASIARLGCGHIDLSEEVPLEETLHALDELRRAGLVRHIGLCSFGIKDVQRALATGVPIVSNQLCYNLLWRGIEDELLPLCVAHKIGILVWAPLASGVLTGKFNSADDVPAGRARTRIFCGVGEGKRPQTRHKEPGLEREAFEAIAKCSWIAERFEHPEKGKQSVPLATLALAWVRQQPVSVPAPPPPLARALAVVCAGVLTLPRATRADA